MNTETSPKAEVPPRLIAAFSGGFQTVANHLYLLIFPIGLDLLLWFGPRMRVRTLFQPLLDASIARLSTMNQTALTEMLPLAKEAWQSTLEQFNLFSALRALPIGVPSLLGYRGPLENPFGPAQIVESSSGLGAVFFWLTLSVIGLALGVYYFHLLARAVDSEHAADPRSGSMGWQAVQTLLLVILLFAILAIIAVPTVLLITVVSIISPALSQFILILVSILALWVVLPLVFSPHGIFSYRLDAVRSALLSYRLVRVFLPGTGMFVLIAMLISRGMDSLWLTPPGSSWMLLVGIFGHAFVSSGLVTASFIYYKMGMRWMEYTLQNGRPPAVRI
jgi:hypothetical protein